MRHCYLAKRNETERIYKHIILGEIMEENGGPDVAGGRSLLYRTDRQTDRVRTH